MKKPTFKNQNERKTLWVYLLLCFALFIISAKSYSQCTAPPTNTVNWVSNTLIGGTITMNSIDVGGDRNVGANISGTALFVNTANSFSIPATSATINTDVAYNSFSGGQQQVYSHGRVDPFASVTGLRANTTYYFKLVGYYLCNGTYYYEQIGKDTSATTCGTDNLVTNPVFSAVAAASMTLSSFTAPAGSTPTGYVVKMNTIDSFTPLAAGTAVPSGNTLYSGGEQIVYGGTSNTPNINITGLTGNTDYYFKIYAYFETCSQRQYQQTGYGFSKYTGNNKVLPQISIDNIGRNINAPDVTLFPSSNSTAPFSYQIISATGVTAPTFSGNVLSIPSVPGFFTIEATQAPNATHLGGTATFTLNVVAIGGPPIITFANTSSLDTNVIYATGETGPLSLTGGAINSTSSGSINYSIEGDANGHSITGNFGAQVLNYSYQPASGGSIVIKGFQDGEGLNPAHEFYFGVTFVNGNGVNATAPMPITPLSFVGNRAIPGQVINLRAKEPMILPVFGTGITYDYTIEGANPSGSTINNGILTVRGQHGIGSAQLTIRVTATRDGAVLFYEPTTTKDFTIDIFTGFNLGQTITFPELAEANLGDVIPLQAYSSSGLAVTYASSDTSIATISGNMLTVVGIGNTNITASQPGNVSYLAATDVIQPLTTNGAAQEITFNALADKVVTDIDFDLTATSDSGLPVSYTSSNTEVATISGNTVSIIGVGTTNITASQAGDSAYNPANDVIQTLTVNKADQMITFGPLANVALDTADFNLTATSDAGLPVSYTSSNTSVATISGNTVSIVGLGVTNITASQAGNTIYNAATDVVNSLTVNTFLIQDQTVAISPVSGVCSVDAGVTVVATQNNVNYYLRNDSNNALIEAKTGTGSSISFTNETLTVDKTYNVVGVDATQRLNALQFDGVDGFVEIPNTINSEFSSNRITVETWAYIPSSDDTDQYTSLITEEFNNNKIKYQISINQGKLETGFYNSGWTITPPMTYPKDQWIHIASTYDQANIILYINGVEVTRIASTASLPAGNGAWRLGRRWDGGTIAARIFGGKLADTRIWNVAKSITEINANMNSHITSATGLVGSYTYEETSGTTLTDKTGNGFNGTLTDLAGDTTNWVMASNLLEMTDTPTVTVGPIADQTVNLSQVGNDVTVSLANSQIGADYILRDNTDNTVIETKAGTGSAIDFSIDVIAADKTYNVFADGGTCSLQMANTPTAVFSNNVLVSPKIYLQGAATNPNTGEETLMRDDLRISDMIPLTSPYTDGVTADASVFTTTGANAIVDWVWVELRDATDASVIIDNKSALLQRDGDVTDIDGISPLSFQQSVGTYYIAIKHRNHLSIRSATTYSLSVSNTVVDLSSSSSALQGGSNAAIDMGNSIFAIPVGDQDENGQVQNADINAVILELGGSGYSKADMDMNGQIQNTDVNTLMNPNLGKGEQF